MKRQLMVILTILGALLLAGATVQALATGHHPSPVRSPAEERPVGAPGPPEASIQAETSQAGAARATCHEGEQASEAQYLICVPEGDWSDLLVYAHGYVAPDRPVEIPQDQMVLGDVSITETVTGLGFAFATTSYSTNGLAVLPALSDLTDLVRIFTTTVGVPDHVYLAGVSEGGLVTALSVEQHPEIYDGGLAMCGPYGDFHGQINHFGDFRVVFDYFFPGLMPGDPLSIPVSLKEDWQGDFFTETIEPEITDPAKAVSVTELLTVTNVSPYQYAPPTSTDSIKQLLWYNVFATNDGVEKLGGQPFDNQDRIYRGSGDDALLNAEVTRISADPAAVAEIEANYQTSGELSVPVVTLHTTGDEVVPYWHATRYASKTEAAGSGHLHEHYRVNRHGHCNFGMLDILTAFDRLVAMVREQESTYVFLPLIVRP